MKGGYIEINEAYEVAKVLGVTMEELLTGNYDGKKVYSPEQQKYIDKLIEILNGNNEEKKNAIKTILDNLKRDQWSYQQKNKIEDELFEINKILCLKCWNNGYSKCQC